MTPDEQLRHEIQEGEAWLRDVMDEPPESKADRMRLRAEIAVNEEWLRPRLQDDVPSGLADRIKTRVRAELTGANDECQRISSSAPVDTGRTRRVYRWVGGFAAIAAVCAIAFVGVFRLETTDVDLSLVTAFEHFTEDEFAEDVDAVLDDLSELAPGAGAYAVRPGDDELFEQLSEELESLIEDEGYSDWS